jgi:hypothetical protein
MWWPVKRSEERRKKMRMYEFNDYGILYVGTCSAVLIAER